MRIRNKWSEEPTCLFRPLSTANELNESIRVPASATGINAIGNMRCQSALKRQVALPLAPLPFGFARHPICPTIGKPKPLQRFNALTFQRLLRSLFKQLPLDTPRIYYKLLSYRQAFFDAKD